MGGASERTQVMIGQRAYYRRHTSSEKQGDHGYGLRQRDHHVRGITDLMQ